MKILYGGAFNPPTLAHLAIIDYLVNKYPSAEIVILPASEHYKKDIISFSHRKKMLEILCKVDNKKLSISDYEVKQDKFKGTYYTLQAFNNPYFVIGADQVLELKQWIKFPEVIKENKFIVFPRNSIDSEQNISNNPLLKDYIENFTFIEDFNPLDISSSQYRLNKKKEVISKKIAKYIKKNKLY